ncbi:MAG: MBL fold metallo-hydrolase [Myxococcaceae bacterium]|nr:MBL fold metallo-hydrolase [Myxococcaceae bacterium]
MASRSGSAIARVLLVVSGLIVLGVAFLYTRLPRPEADRVEAALDVVGVDTGGAFAWILRTPHGAALIDAGLDPKAEAILTELRHQGLGPDDVHTVLLTHGHADHFGGAGAFSKAKVYVGADDAAFVRGEATPKGAIQSLFRRFAPEPARPAPSAIATLRGGETLEVDGISLKVIAVPGHTPGSLMYLHEGLLFTGDSLVGRDDGRKVGLVPASLSADADQNERSLRPLLALPFTAIADGHTGVVADARQKLARLLGKDRAGRP